MIPGKKKPSTIEEYINDAPEEIQDRLHQMHTCIREAAPGATENLKWNMPAYSYKRILVTFAVFRHHIGLYPTHSAVEAFAKSLEKYKTARGSIQLPLNQPLPLSLITKIVKFRVRESLEADIKWKS